MSHNVMADRVELSEALRSILDDPDDQKENQLMTDDVIASSLRDGVKSCVTPISRALGSVTRHSTRPVLGASTDQHNLGMLHIKRGRSGLDGEGPSPPKKRRHANHVIILRQPRGKGKPLMKSSPNPSPNRKAPSAPSESKPAIGDGVKRSWSDEEFTVELDSGIGAPAADFTPSRMLARGSSHGDPTPLKSVRIDAPGSAERCLDAAIDKQIKTELSEEELESGLPLLDDLDLVPGSPFCHFRDDDQRQLYSELGGLLEPGSLEGNQWPASRDDALQQMPASQQMLQYAGNVCFGDGGRPVVRGENPLGRLLRVGSTDDSLTNITWLKRMSAPDLDPNSLQTSQMIDPRFERPTYSYSTLIQFAISSSKSGKMTLRDIYTWIEETFPFFKTAKAGWRNSIRHNLSLHKIFVREPPLSHGQPAFWTLRPGTVVHLPEHRMFVADSEHGGTLLEEVAPPAPPVPPPAAAAADRQQGGVPYFMGGAMPPVVMVPGLPAGTANAHNSKDCKGPGVKTKKPPLILPRGSQPYALIPVPMLLPATQTAAPTLGDGTQGLLPHILSPIIMGGVGRLRSSAQRGLGGRPVVPIAPKVSLDVADNPSWSDANGASSNSLSSGSDSAVDLSGGPGWTSGLISTAASETSGDLLTPRQDLPHGKRVHGRKSLPEVRRDLDETDEDDSFTAFFEQELASPPKPQTSKGAPVVSTPCKESDLRTLLSPLRGFTPFKSQPLDPDSGFFQDLHGDLSFAPLRVGLSPDCKGSRRGSGVSGPRGRGQRSRAGSLGELGLPGLTPEKDGSPTGVGGGTHNHSFAQIFGDLDGLDLEGDHGLDAGNISWSLFSPSKQHAK